MFQRLAILAVVLSARALACTCAFSGETAREAWKDRPYVFLGTVVSVVPDRGQMFTPHVAQIRVDEAFKGVTAGQILQLHGGGNSCSAIFRTGDRAVYYLSGGQGKFYLEPCRISMGSAEPEGEDLLFLHGLPGTAKGTRLSGTVHTKELAGGVRGALVEVATPTGQTLRQKTNSAGAFEFYGLPPGKYRVAITPPQGFRRAENNDSYSTVVTLKRDGSQHVYSSFEYDTRVEGKVAVAGWAHVELVPVAPNPKRKWMDSETAKKGGRFVIRDIEPGSYWLRVTAKPDGEGLTSTFYYPGTRTRAAASAITIEAGHRLKNIALAPPANEETVQIAGTLRYSDGQPVSDGSVRFEAPTGLDYSASVRTAANGTFSLRVVKGVPGTVTGVFSFFMPDVAKCPQFDEPDPIRQGILQSRRTPSFPISGDESTSLDLQLPFPSCPAHYELRNKK